MRHDDSTLAFFLSKTLPQRLRFGDSNSHCPPTRHGRTPGHIDFSQDARDADKDEIRNDKISSVTTSNVYLLSLIILHKFDRYLSQFKTMKSSWALLYAYLFFSSAVSAGPAAYGVCQAGCATVVMACYSAAGFTWGATMGITAPASILGCNSAFGTCQAACASVLLAPTF